jgi:hypothetical protein
MKIKVTLGDLFGDMASTEGLNPENIHWLDTFRLRDIAKKAFQRDLKKYTRIYSQYFDRVTQKSRRNELSLGQMRHVLKLLGIIPDAQPEGDAAIKEEESYKARYRYIIKNGLGTATGQKKRVFDPPLIQKKKC